MTKPIIAVTAGQKPPHADEGRTVVVGCDIDYLIAVALSGGAPVILPSVADHEAIGAILAHVDGVLLTGGGDIHAERYGEAPHPASRLHDPDRDHMELEVTRRAVAMGLPLLGICRGLQLLNVAHGGTLVQDIPSEIPGALEHYIHDIETRPHPINIEPDTRLAEIMHADAMLVNSWHHQAVKAVGAGLRIAARAEDGVIEALEAENGAPILAVQCHPEAGDDHYPTHLTLFAWLVEEAMAYRERQYRSAL
jgi:putative glutamine amidotransferase